MNIREKKYSLQLLNSLQKNQFISTLQAKTLKGLLNGEESAAFVEMIERLYSTIQNMPVTYQQDGKGGEAVAFLHYFTAYGDFFITEKDIEGGVLQAYGLASINGAYPEMGYISIIELVQNNAEIDLHFAPQTLNNIKITLQKEVKKV